MNNENIYLSGKTFSQGDDDMLDAIATFEVGDHHQAQVYYDSGIPEFDKLFYPEGYIKLGYVCQLLASIDGITLYFSKKVRDETRELAGAHIHRTNILDYETEENNNLVFVKEEFLKHKAKLLGKSAFGLVGSLTGHIADEFTVVNTEEYEGHKLTLNYENEQGAVQKLVLYCSSEFLPNITLFLNTYWKSALPKELIESQNSSNNSNCFIATACYKDLYSEEVIAFRKYRDEELKKSMWGRAFIRLYYKLSPLVLNLYIKMIKSQNL
ncbi:CFI-box-CTERM domain-containing protein [Nonlabens agnitus]|uniref:Uncharacterized protein n=1 Tax=Nonlabens agnitus TaxID=870484 RepID=A0A2S9WT88_9FLAO|nr:CFI-box-CTERM domain-containing protein [Nonlabens agnitus]PRP66660.1 hypothetical protein BST86_05860 [Nonlabens agnitus]